MKNYILIILIILIGILNSCTDVLDIAPDGNMSMQDVLSDPDKVESLMNSLYNNIPMKGYTYYWWERMVVSASDDAWSSDDRSFLPLAQLYADATSASYHPMQDGLEHILGDTYRTLNYWSRYWSQIRLCSEFLENIQGAAVKSEENRARMAAEAHVLRAFFYSELVKWYGKLPVIESTLDIDTDFSRLKRESVYNVAKFITADCDAAINTRELPWRITVESDAMRVTKAVAYAIKAKMMLFAASPLHNEGHTEYWEEAYQTCKQAVNALKSNGYELSTTCTQPDFYDTGDAAAFQQFNCEQADYSASPRDKETIWQHKNHAGHRASFVVSYVASGFKDTYKCGACPSQELIDAFETTNGKTVLNLAKPYNDEKHLNPNYNSDNELYHPNNPYANRDPRLYATALMNGSVIEYDDELVTIETFVGGRNAPSYVQGNYQYSRTGYFYRKTVPPGASSKHYRESPTWKLFTLSELMLDYAEAAAEAGHLDDARIAANEIRARVKMPALPSLSQDELILRIRNERRIELALNENRYFDLRRWERPDGDLSETCKWFTAMRIVKQPDGSFTYTREAPYGPRGGYQNKDLLLPIPLKRSECNADEYR
ncbi:MAG: RagB/SusD family nutrient uptake outer membrane protein [Mangrovibacterium sp.]